MSTPLSSRISSAAGVTGPLAPSQMIDALTLSALSWVITCSSAQGASTSQSTSEQLLVRDLVGAAQAAQRARSPACARARRRRRSPSRCRARRRVRDRDDRRPLLGEELREEAADVAEALDGDAQAFERELALADRLLDAVEAAARGRLHPPERAADVERLAGDDAEHRVALVHRVRVEDPGHHRPVGADVRRRDVLLRADLVDDLASCSGGSSARARRARASSGRRSRRPLRRRTGCSSARTSRSSTSRAP